MPKLDVKVEGLDRLRSTFTPSLVKSALRDALDEIGKAGAAAAKSGAPRRTGKLAGSTGHRVSGTAYASVRVTATRRGFPYPKALEYSARYGHKGWLRRAVDRVARRFDSILQGMGRKIEERVSSRG